MSAKLVTSLVMLVYQGSREAKFLLFGKGMLHCSKVPSSPFSTCQVVEIGYHLFKDGNP